MNRIYDAVCLKKSVCSLVRSSNQISAMNSRNHLSRYMGLMERNPRFLRLCCIQKGTDNHMFEPVHVALQLQRSRMVADEMYAVRLAFHRLHLVLAKKSVALLGEAQVILKKNFQVVLKLCILAG